MPKTRYTRLTRLQTLFVLVLAAVLIAGCSSPRKSTAVSSRGGGYYMDDGPGKNIPPGIEKIPDAVPRIEPHNPANFRPYRVLGQRFTPVSANTQLRQKGVASWYGRKFHGKKTANGETYDMYAMTAAHPTLPLPSYARVTHANNGRSVIVRVNDRGPFLRGRVIDLSYAAAAKLGLIGPGSDEVIVEAITHADIRKGTHYASAPKATKVAASEPTARTTKAATKPAVATTVVTTPPAGTTATAPVASAPAGAAIAVAEVAIASSQATATTPAATTPDALSVLNEQDIAGGAPATATAQLASVASPAPTVTEENDDGVYLQFGAFSSFISADRLTNRLNGEIAHVEFRDVHIDTKDNLHRVRVGPYPSRTHAVNAAVRIQDATGMRATVAQR